MVLILTATVAFLLAGFIKGVVGFGFPIVSLIVLTLAIGLFDALAIIVVPTIVTNIWQALSGPHIKAIIERMWIYFTCAMGGILLASVYLVSVDVNLLTGVLGIVLFVFAVFRLLNVHLSVAREREPLLSIVLGSTNGLLTGFTGSFMVPSVLYMQALGFRKDMLVQAMGAFFALSTIMLTVSLGRNGLITIDDAIMSAIALVPAFAGIFAGRWMRERIDEDQFQRIFLGGVLALGAYIAWRSFGTLWF
ncbi:MAG: sulfite exporter TauE/SafE family protein [Woeseiaceae bacterium]|nr:sulfite exporter TauE/SafE family protein [Woeseiaceae bacterium]